MDQTQQRVIAQGLRTGQPEAWRDFYDAFAERVWRDVARLLGPNSADVADVVQETFLAAARSARGFDPAKGSLWAWLWGIAHHHAALHLRKQARRDRLTELAALNGRLKRWLDGDEAIDKLHEKELAEHVRLILAELPAEYGAVLTAKYLDEVPVEQLAREERCSEVAIRSRLARARAAFRQAFGHAAARGIALGGCSGVRVI
jgi:RNA polymerase sigma-70 factor (ECF subfamily)